MPENDEKYRKYMFIPIILIVTSLYIIGYKTVNKMNMNAANVEVTTISEAEGIHEEINDCSEDGLDKSSDNDLADKSNELININTATAEQLMTLEGIGEKRAADIIEMRGKMGRYKTTSDLLNVDGIGEKTFEKLKDKICVD